MVSKGSKSRNREKPKNRGGRPKGLPKTGGRQKGTPNLRTADLAARLEELGCDPIEGMATIAMNRGNAPELRGRMYAELAGYLYPKRKAIEIAAEDNSQGDFLLEEALIEYYRRITRGAGHSVASSAVVNP